MILGKSEKGLPEKKNEKGNSVNKSDIAVNAVNKSDITVIKPDIAVNKSNIAVNKLDMAANTDIWGEGDSRIYLVVFGSELYI